MEYLFPPITPQLSLDDLREMKPGTIFATGNIENGTDDVIKIPFSLPSLPNTIKWVAKRGQIHDWAIYYGLSDTDVVNCGFKLYNIVKIKELVPCLQEALEIYRF